MGTTPDSMTALEAGNYPIKVKQDGYADWSETATIKRGRTSELSASLEKMNNKACQANTSGTESSSSELSGTMVHINGDCFQMGSNRSAVEKPVHSVCVKDFQLGKTEVTQGQWRAVMGSNSSGFSTCGDNCPIEKVSWDDVQGFLNKLK